MRWLAMLCVVLVLCTCPARAVSPEEVLESQEDALGIEEVEREAQRQGGSAVYGESLDQGLEGLIETGKGEMFGIVRTGVRSAVILFLILLLCGVVQTVYDAGGGDEIPAVSLAGALAVTVAAVSDMNALLGLGSAAVERMGKRVYLVEGDEENLKITTPVDLILAEAILHDREERR